MKKILLAFLLVLSFVFVGCEVTTLTPEERMDRAKTELLTDYDLTNITEDITLKTLSRGVKITWTSSDAEVISTSGVVTRDIYDVIVTLEATLTYAELEETISFTLTVKGTATEEDKNNNNLAAVKEYLKNEYNNISTNKNITLVTSISSYNGIVITWESSNQSVLTSNGIVNQGTEDIKVTLTFNVYNTNFPETVVTDTVEVTVLKKSSVVIDTPNLDEALNYVTNYYAVFTMADSNNIDETYLYVDGYNLMQYTENFGSEYLEYDEKSDVYYYYGLVYDEWVKISSLEDDFENYAYFAYFDLTTITSEMFSYENGVYTALPEYVTLAGTAIFDAYENEIYNTVQLTVENNRIVKVVANSTCVGEEYSYEVVLSDFGTTEVIFPNVDGEGGNDDEIISINEALALPDDTTVKVSGVITNIVGYCYYIQDETGSLYVYSSVENTAIALGKVVTVEGTLTTYSGLQELTGITSFEVTGESTYEVNLLTDIETSTLEYYLSSPVSTVSFTISSLQSYSNITRDFSFVITDGLNDLTVFIGKRLDDATKNTLKDYLNTKTVGDIIKINNAAVSYHNAYQIAMTLGSTITDGYTEGDPITLSYLSSTFESLIVEYGTTLEDALNDTTITKHYNNGSSETAVRNEMLIESTYSPYMAGTYSVKITIGTCNVTISITVNQKPSETYKPNIGEIPLLSDTIKTLGYDSSTSTLYGLNQAIDNTGTQNILIIPVDFSDYPATTTIKTDLEKAAFGTSTETGWESLQSYYYKSSYGKLTIQGQVLDVYHTNRRSTSYSNDTGSYDILASAIEYYDTTIDYSNFDNNNDGYIDGIYLVYTAPVNYEDSNSLWWAFCDIFQEEETEVRYDNTGIEFYMFMGYDFFFEAFIYGETENDDEYVTYNAQTIVHETGHLLGLNDYYGSYEAPCYSTGGGVMMDLNIGDHDPFSKIIMGWTSPYIVNGTTSTITLNPFESSGDVILIPYNWNGSYFSEYLLIDYFTPTGLNEIFKDYNGMFSISGIRIYHIDATLKSREDAWYVWDIYQYSNGSSRQLIKLVENDTTDSILNNYIATNDDLFLTNDSLSSYRWNNNSSINFSITVNEITSANAKVTITY